MNLLNNLKSKLLYKYALQAAATFAFHLFNVYIFSTVFNWHPTAALATSMVLSFIFSFAVLKFYVFKSQRPTSLLLVQTAMTSVSFRLAELLSFHLLLALWEHSPTLLAALVLIAANVLKYFAYRAIFTNQASRKFVHP